MRISTRPSDVCYTFVLIGYEPPGEMSRFIMNEKSHNPHNMIEYPAVNYETNNNTCVLVSSSADHDINDNRNVIIIIFTRLLCIVINESHYKPNRALTRLIIMFSWFRVVLLSSNILQLEPSTLPRCDAADEGYEWGTQIWPGSARRGPFLLNHAAAGDQRYCNSCWSPIIPFINHQFQCRRMNGFSMGN